MLTDSLSLHSTLMGNSGHNGSIGVTKSLDGHPKGTTDDIGLNYEGTSKK